jgi:NADPH:quinone reductase-like Zn-dependent oxidoreductase
LRLLTSVGLDGIQTDIPWITERKWNDLLIGAGFSGNDLVLKNHDDDTFYSPRLILSSIPSSVELCAKDTTFAFLIDPASQYQKNLAGHLFGNIKQSQGLRPITISLQDIGDNTLPPDAFLISLLETDGPILQTLSETDFSFVQSLILNVRHLLWVTSTSAHSLHYPESGMMRGLARSLRSERSSLQIISLTLEDESLETASGFEALLNVLRPWLSDRKSEEMDVEYIFRAGQLHIARLTEEPTVEPILKSLLYPQLRREPWDPQVPLTLSIGIPGSLESLRFIHDPLERTTALGPDEVEIEAQVWGLNFRDVLVALGRLEESTFGFEAAGYITRVGSSCGPELQPGDRVIMVNTGCLKMYARCNQRLVRKLPNSVSLQEAAAAAGVGITAYHSLVKVAKLRPGEKVLIHSGSGGTGQMAIRIAQMIGAEVFATVGHDEKKQLLLDQMHLPEDHVLYSRDTSFAQGIRRMTRGYGVDVVLNSLAGDKLVASWECIAPYGRFVEIGKADIHSNSGLPMSPFAKNVTFSTVDFVHMSETNTGQAMVQNLLGEFFDLMAHKTLLPPFPIHLYPLSAVEDAFRFMQSGKNSGRTVLSSQPTDAVATFGIASQMWRFDDNATYIIAGGTGGLGRSIARWMVRKGARHLLLLSRSGVSAPAVSQHFSELRGAEVNLQIISCDVSSIEAVRDALDVALRTMPPIKGCLNACMVLRVSVQLVNISEAPEADSCIGCTF